MELPAVTGTPSAERESLGESRTRDPAMSSSSEPNHARPAERRPGGRTSDNTRRIVAATIDLLIDGGFDAVGFAAVAELAGVSRATMYRRWESPAHLTADAIRHNASDSIPIPDSGNLHDDLAAILAHIGDFLDTPLGRSAITANAQILANHHDDTPTPAWSLRWIDVEPVFQRAKDRHELPPEADAEAVFAAAAGALYFRTLVMGATADSAWIHRTLDVVLAPT